MRGMSEGRTSEHGARSPLVRTGAEPVVSGEWSDQARSVLRGWQGFVRVLGGPGTGKTTLLGEAAARRIVHGQDPEQLLVLTASRHAANSLRSSIARLVTAKASGSSEPGGLPLTVREPLVRTVHSYAFGVLRAQASLDGSKQPRLLSGPEQDAVVRELLDGDLDSGAWYWPEKLRPALNTPGFAEELRDLLMRAAERGLAPGDLVELGKREGRQEWVAAGTFWEQYEQVTVLQGIGGSALAAPAGPALDAAELVSSALAALAEDPDLLGRERTRVRYLLVDDAQHLDPLQWKLLNMIGDAASEFIMAGDPDQAVYTFRGADAGLFAEADPAGDRSVVLGRGYRMSEAVHDRVAGIAGTLAGTGDHRGFGARRPAVPSQDDDSVLVRLFPTPAAEAGWIADQLRRAHLIDGIGWSDMAVIARSATRTFPTLQRALRSAGVPVAHTGLDLPLAHQPAVRPLLTALRALADPSTIDVDTAEQLLTSPLGGADPLALRRLRRGLRRLDVAAGGTRSSDELLTEAVRSADPLTALADSEAGALRRVSFVLSTGRAALDAGSDVQHVLWELWQASGLQHHWLTRSQNGGSLGRQADDNLDAIVALFHAAGQYVDRLPHAGVVGFVDYLFSQQIAGDSLAPAAARSDGVELVTAHGATGREWTVVAIAGMQEGSWPDLRLRGTLLGVERLVDVLSGVQPEGVSAVAPILAEERRLFYVAASRASRRLLASAVSGEDEQPSRFLDDLAGEDGQADASARSLPGAERPLVLASLVGDLRVAACDPQSDESRRRRAARQLARLARAGVPGAHPDSWYGLAGVSTEASLQPAGEVVALSPSTVDLLVRCPLRWLIERSGGTDPATLPAITGTLVHGLAHAAANGAGEEELNAALHTAWTRVDAGAPWFARRERQRVADMVDAFTEWLRLSRDELTQESVEADVEIEIPGDDGSPRVRLRGRVDRLERDQHDRAVIVDIKTAKTPVSHDDATQHPQLATYQLAVSLSQSAAAGGARLIYPAKRHNKTGATQRSQDPLDGQALQDWLEVVRSAATASVGPAYLARENPDCPRCPARSCCPLQPEGRQVT